MLMTKSGVKSDDLSHDQDNGYSSGTTLQDDISDTWRKSGKYSSLSEKILCWLPLLLSAGQSQVTYSYMQNDIGTGHFGSALFGNAG